jgi:hypothetical protein
VGKLGDLARFVMWLGWGRYGVYTTFYSKIPLERPRGRSMDNIKMGLKETGCEARKLMELITDHVEREALVLAVLKLRVRPPQC